MEDRCDPRNKVASVAIGASPSRPASPFSKYTSTPNTSTITSVIQDKKLDPRVWQPVFRRNRDGTKSKFYVNKITGASFEFLHPSDYRMYSEDVWGSQQQHDSLHNIIILSLCLIFNGRNFDQLMFPDLDDDLN